MKCFRLLSSLLFGAILVISACGSDPEPEQEEVVRFILPLPSEGSSIRAGTGKTILGEPIRLLFDGAPKDLRIHRVIPPTFSREVPFRIEGTRKSPEVRVLGPFSLADSVLDLRVAWSTGATRIQFRLVTF